MVVYDLIEKKALADATDDRDGRTKDALPDFIEVLKLSVRFSHPLCLRLCHCVPVGLHAPALRPGHGKEAID
jgi:hypothetical protein